MGHLGHPLEETRKW